MTELSFNFGLDQVLQELDRLVKGELLKGLPVEVVSSGEKGSISVRSFETPSDINGKLLTVENGSPVVRIQGVIKVGKYQKNGYFDTNFVGIYDHRRMFFIPNPE